MSSSLTTTNTIVMPAHVGRPHQREAIAKVNNSVDQRQRNVASPSQCSMIRHFAFVVAILLAADTRSDQLTPKKAEPFFSRPPEL